MLTASPNDLLRDRLPNASVGKPYEASFSALFHVPEHANDLESIDVALPAECGIAYDAETRTFRGVPTIAGELQVEVTITPRLSRKIAITINPDPSTLWKDQPSDPKGQFAKSDTDTRFLETPHLWVIAASLRGRSHAHEGKYRDDDFQLTYMPDTGWHLFAVADGAGAAEFSRRGSQLACDTVLRALESRLRTDNQLDQEIERHAAEQMTIVDEQMWPILHKYLIYSAFDACQAIAVESKNHKADLRKFATTLLLAIAKPVQGGWFFGGFAVGDGGAGVLVNDDALLSLTKPDSGEFSGQTVFLTSPQVFSHDETAKAAIHSRLRAGFAPEFKMLGLMTDGVSDPKFESDANLAAAGSWDSLRSELAQSIDFTAPTDDTKESLLDWLRFPSPGNHDDRTIVVAVPKTPAQV